MFLTQGLTVDKPRETYHAAYLPFFAVCVGTGLTLGALVIVGAAWLGGRPVVWPGLLRALVVGLAIGVLLTAVAVTFFPVFVFPSGVRSVNLWGVYRTVRWPEIASVGRFNLLGLRYLVVRSSKGGRIYVPLFLTEVRRFQESVEEKAGADSPLAVALKERLG